MLETTYSLDDSTGELNRKREKRTKEKKERSEDYIEKFSGSEMPRVGALPQFRCDEHFRAHVPRSKAHRKHIPTSETSDAPQPEFALLMLMFLFLLWA